MNTFSRRVGVEFFGDAASLEKSFATAGVATKEYGDLAVSTNTKVTAATIAGTTKRIEATRASIAEFQSASASYVKGSDQQIAATYQLGLAQKRLAVLTGETAIATARTGGVARTAERDLGKTTRGLLAGSGAAAGLGRSLAFASGGFLAVASGATLIRDSIKGAESLEKAQTGLSVAIQKTGGNLAKLEPQYAATAKRAQEFGINQADALTGLERATVLTGNAAKAQRGYQEALVISKATGKDFNAVLTATSKGQEGITTSLQRYGIRIAKGTSGTQQFVTVMSRFAGQAKANTSQSEKFNATLANSEEIVGTALLPTFNKYLGELGNWIDKMNKSGRLQKDVNGILHVTGDVFHTLGTVIGTVDKVTGSFANTLKLLVAFKFASLIGGWIGSLKTLAVEWGLVRTAAIEATAAETAAGAGAGAAGAAAAGGGGIVAAGRFAGRAAAIEAAAPFAAFAAIPAIAALSPVRGPKNLKIQGYTSDGQPLALGSDGKSYVIGGRGYREISKAAASSWTSSFVGVAGAPVITKETRNFARTGRAVPAALTAPGFQVAAKGGTPVTGGPFGSAQPVAVYAGFQLTQLEQLAQARAALTKGTADDVSAAKQIIARIKKLIDRGRLSTDAMIQSLQAEAGALGTIQSAAQARQAARQAAQAKALAAASTFDIPPALQVAQARLQAYGKDQTKILHEIIAAANNAIRSGKKNWQGLVAAYNALGAARQALASNTVQNFQVSARLTLALAKEQALGLPTTATLEAMKKALLKWLHAGKRTIAQQTDAYNQLASINSQLGSQVTSLLGGFKQASTRALTAGLGLTPDQRRALRARLSQLGPGQTVPGAGVGAAGFIIGTDGRPLVVHTHVNIDGKRVADNTTHHQQKRRRRNSSQRRGPNAGAIGP